MTILEALTRANNLLKEPTTGKLDAPMLDAQVLLAHVLGVPTSWLFAHPDSSLDPVSERMFFELVSRRSLHEPVAYLTGHKDFYRRSFHVSQEVLIPRPETEQLVEVALASMKEPEKERTLFADIGTGSGAIAITLALESRVPVIAVEIDKEAVQVARRNIEAHGVRDLVDLREGNLATPLLAIFNAMKQQGLVPYQHLILVANLPYLSEHQWEHAPIDLSYEPKGALTAGVDGLDAYWVLFRQLKTERNLLPFRVTTIVELDPQQASTLPQMISRNFTFAKHKVLQDLHGLARVLVSEI
jgi:release factor glutamine methyltransferase